MFILGTIKGWASRKIDYVQAFSQAELGDEEVYMNIPRGFHADDSSERSNHVLKLKRNLHGLKQASYNWSELLKN